MAAAPKIKTLKEEIKALNEISKLKKGLTDLQKDEFDSLRKSLKALLDINKHRADEIGKSKTILSLSAQIRDSIISKKSSMKLVGQFAQAHLDIEADLLKNVSAIGTELFDRVDLSELETLLKEKSAKLTIDELKHVTKLLDTEKTRADLQVKMNKQAGEAATLLTDQVDKVESLIQSLPGGQFLSTLFDFDKVKEGLTEAISGTFQQAQGEFLGTFGARTFGKELFGTKATKLLAAGAAKVGAIVGRVLAFAIANPFAALGIGVILATLGKLLASSISLANELGISYGQAFKLGGALLIGADQAKALVDEFGTLDEITAKTVTKMRILEFQYGLSTDATAKIMHNLRAISGLTSKTALDTIEWIGDLARAERVSPAAVLEDIASNTEFFADYGKIGGRNLAIAAIQAKKLGVSLSTVAGIAENLLEFETSIEKQMEASILLGRELNLDKARMLAFTGDMEGMQREVLKLIGSQAQFEAMNVIQRKALADAIGTSTTELSKMITNQAKLNEMSESAAFITENWDNTMKSISKTFATIMPYLKWIGVAIGLLFIPLLIKGLSYIWQQNVAYAMQLKLKKRIVREEVKSLATKRPGGLGLGINPVAMLKGAAALLVMAGALWVTGKALQQFKNIGTKELGMAALALGGLLGIAALASVAAPALILGAGAILIMSSALWIFGKAIQSIGTGFSILNEVLTGLAPISTEIYALGEAFGSLGAGLIKMSIGTALLSPFLPVLKAISGFGGTTETTTAITIDLSETNILLKQLLTDNNKLMIKNIAAITSVEKAVKRSKLTMLD